MKTAYLQATEKSIDASDMNKYGKNIFWHQVGNKWNPMMQSIFIWIWMNKQSQDYPEDSWIVFLL